MALVPNDFIESVVPIGVAQSPSQNAWMGTGFLVSVESDEDPAKTYLFLVSNKHVFQNLSSVVIEINTAKGPQTISLTLQSGGKQLYSFHSNNDVDVAAVFVPGYLINAVTSTVYSFSLKKNCLDLATMAKSGISEGTFAYEIGFPMLIVNQTMKEPFVRCGCISRIKSCYSGASPFYICDMQTFPGSSGSPVINKAEVISVLGTKSFASCALIGILSSYIPYNDALISRQTGRVMMTTEENSGLTIVFPSDFIRDVVRMEVIRTGLNNVTI
jgi:hypothetical protein